MQVSDVGPSRGVAQHNLAGLTIGYGKESELLWHSWTLRSEKRQWKNPKGELLTG